ncbi:hypothetical protein AJ79_00234 [Helicocarpus griseus UAMH5409]|uniref:Myb-like DNA-binding domain-containing protein n=1 Tax=Helicocarpus griseus UAMH5409 TaxID=1447875 RepID=A0A2B7YCN4_9EURO|nr:hypothetical protein AJ79_00234 [Helicocarpus griseus UAMH5409]
MSRVSSEEQLNFLLKCVKHSSNGKVDFTEVAKECNIVSKGAAAKRYERLMKANGINPNGGPLSTSDAPSPSDAGSSTTTTPKKPTTPKTPQTPGAKGKGGAGGNKTPSTRKRKTTGNKAGGGSVKKIKSEEGVEEDSDVDGDVGDSKVYVKKEMDDADADVDRDDDAVAGADPEAASLHTQLLGENGAMRSGNDPFLTQESKLAGDREDGVLYNEFCAINAIPKWGGDGAGDSAGAVTAGGYGVFGGFGSGSGSGVYDDNGAGEGELGMEIGIMGMGMGMGMLGGADGA